MKEGNSGQVVLKDISQVGIVVRDIEKSIALYTSILGIGPFRLVGPEEMQSTDMILRGRPAYWKVRAAFAQVGPVTIELIEHLDGESLLKEFLEARGEGLHHLGCLVDDIEQEIEKFEKQGITVLQQGTNIGRSKWAYLDTEPISGIIIELRQVLKIPERTGGHD